MLRQDPDVILVGELRDLETISTALTAAETGHLVFATLHTQDAPSTIDRMIDVFPPSQQEQIRIQLASSLRGVVTQQLVPDRRRDGPGGGRRGARVHAGHPEPDPGGQDPPDLLAHADRVAVRHADDGPEPWPGSSRAGVISVDMGLDRCRDEEDFRNHIRGIA